ncbi:MAG: NUDIX domain-containing protein [Propionibacteriaceae bacterium]|jgi:8-oxo-dGTP pyrophosphatase MutT (NUDIX family)|nr:NUDIX domain-containing protein [Propionibacteriaceae bacterium]
MNSAGPDPSLVKASPESTDASFLCPQGLFRYRAAALIVRSGAVLLAKNDRDDYYYSVGGGVHVGETAEEALRRELLEETGFALEPGPLCVLHENFFVDTTDGTPWHEVALYFRVDVPDEFEPRGDSVTMDGIAEHMEWVPIDALDHVTAHPSWLRDELTHPHDDIRHIVTTQGADGA